MAAAPDVRAVAGRSGELATLHRALLDARAGHTQVVVVEGEPGIGKSALLEAFLADPVVTAGTSRRWVRCDEFEQGYRLGVAERLLGESLTGCSVVEAGRRLLALLGEQQDGGPEGAERHVAVVVVDDAQWMDRASASALQFALRRLRADRVLVLLARRPSPRSALKASPGLRTDDPAATTVVRPRRFDPRAVAELAEGQRGWDLSPALAERLVARTGGLPLLVAAVVRGAADQDQLAAATVTASVAGTVRRLLASLDPAARRLAEAAAVLAEPTPLTVLGQVADVQDPSAALTAATLAGLLTESEQGDVDSAHDLLAEAVRQGLTPVRRRDLHRDAARWTTGDRHLAHRAAASDRPDPVLAADLVAAADAAHAALRYDVAATHRLRARAVSAEPVERERLLVDALVDRVEAEDLDGAGELAPLVEQAPSSARRSLALGLLARERGEVGAARSLLRASLQEAESAGDAGTATRAALAGAVLEVLIGDGAAAMDLLRHTEPPPGSGLATDVAATTGIASWLLGDADGALDVLDGVERTPGGTSSEAELLAVSGMVRFYGGRPRQALADLDASVRMTHLWRPSTNQTRIYLLRSMTRFALGDWDGAAVDAAAARALAAGPTQPWSEALAMAISVDVAAYRGQWRVAEDYLARATDGAPALAQITDVVARHAIELAQARGDHDQVLAVLDPLWSDAFVEALSRTRQVRPMMVARILALVAADRLRDAERALGAYEETNAQWPGGERPAQLGRLRGVLAEARGDPRAAQAHYASDLALPELDHFPFERAQLLIASGRLERTLGHRREAVRRLTEARDLLVRLRARPLLERCTRELAACGLPSRLDDPLALTAREEDVVALVRQGHTNKEVAAALFLTVKTVEYHLRNIYAKLGFASRSELRRLWPGASHEDPVA